MLSQKMGLWFLAAVLGAALSGCNSPRFITANVKTISMDNVPDFSHLVTLVQDAGLSAADDAQAANLRQNTQLFAAQSEKDLDVSGDRHGDFTIHMLAVSSPATSSTFPLPVEMVIDTTSPHHKGQQTTNGFAEIRFGTGGPVYRTDLNNCFFEFEVSDVYNENGDDIASGKFSFIARNKDNLQDKTRLLVMDGAFIARIQ